MDYIGIRKCSRVSWNPGLLDLKLDKSTIRIQITNFSARDDLKPKLTNEIYILGPSFWNCLEFSLYH